MPIVTISIIIICALVFMNECRLSHSTDINTNVLAQLGGVSADLLKAQPYRAFTSMWLHADTSHILFNMVFLFIVGRPLETIFGHWRFLLIYLLSGITGDIIAGIFSKPNIITVGASTALFGLIGTGLLLQFLNPIYHSISASLWSTLIANLIFDVFSPSISLSGHLGGLLGGLIFGFLFRPAVSLLSNILIECILALLVIGFCLKKFIY